jgi:MFS family permease
VGNAAPYLSDIGYSKPLQKSLALLLLSLSGVIATPLGGKVSDFLIDKLGLIKARATSLMFGFAFVSILAVAFPWTATLGYSLALIAIFLVGFGGPWTSGIAWALPTDLDAKNAGTLSGIALIVGQSVGSLSSYLVAQIASLSTEYAWEWAYLVLGIGSMVGIVPCYFLKKIVRRHEDE